MVFKLASKSTPALRRSMLNALNATHQNKKAIDKMWSVANTCPLFIKKPKRGTAAPPKGKKRIVRANRILSNHTIKTLASGGASYASGITAAESAVMRTDTVSESPRYPMLPSVSKGAILLLESYITSLCQEAFANSVALKNAMQKHKKVTFRCAEMGIAVMNDSLSISSGVGPGVCVVPLPLPVPTRVTTAKKMAGLRNGRSLQGCDNNNNNNNNTYTSFEEEEEDADRATSAPKAA
jgi:hypothetical protein